MFKFNFEVDEADDDVAEAFQHSVKPSRIDQSAVTDNAEETTVVEESKELTLDNLTSALPHTISYSPLSIPLASGSNVVLARRDLFDARFQLISSEDAGRKDGRSDVDFVDAPSDLVPGVYEGGLKTWECSLDLVNCLHSIYGDDIGKAVRGKRILELGCGTAVPSLYLLHSVFSQDPEDSVDVVVHLQDYNEMVLRLVTLPNVILAWYMSPASSTFRFTSTASEQHNIENSGEQDEEEPLPPADATQPGELPLTPALITAFLSSLQIYRVKLKFFSGGWATFDVSAPDRGLYNILLTSETIYRTASLASLIELMRRATSRMRMGFSGHDGQGDHNNLAETTAQLSIRDCGQSLKSLAAAPYLCLVAAKLVYFGVGGGVNEFVEGIERSREGGKVQTVWEQSGGVRRRIMRVVW